MIDLKSTLPNDLLHLRWTDVYYETRQDFRPHILVTEHKTKKRKTIAMNSAAIEALRQYYPLKMSDWIFVSRNGGNTPISRQQAWRIIKNACRATGIDGNIACHSLRKTWGYHAWTSPKVCPTLLGFLLWESIFASRKSQY